MELWDMKKLKINRALVMFFLFLTSFNGGCAGMIKGLPPSPGLTKEKIVRGWNRDPDKILTGKKYLKYGADEVWIYKYPTSDEDRFYFKDGVLIKEEEISYGSF